MIDNNPMRAVCNYGSSAPYKDPPTEEQIRCGVIPLDSLPAAWWNWLWNETNGAVNEARTALTSVICEFNNVLCCAGITPQSACMDQLYNAIVCLRQAVATSSVAGSVKSSTTCGKVSVADDGTMTANGLGNVSNLTTTTKTNVVAAINELKATHDSELSTMSGDITALENGKLGCTACATDSAKLGGTEKGGLLTGVSFTNGCVGVTVGGTTCYVGLGSAAQCSTTAFLASDGCAADSAKLGGTAKSGLLTAFSCSNNQFSITVGGTTCTVGITIPAACFGSAVNYTKFVCTTTSGTAAAADCAVTLGLARSYTLCCCPQNTGSYDRRTYSKIGTYQNQGACNGMTYLDTCVWQCCYSGSSGVTTSTNRRWCFCGDGAMYTPGKVEAKSDTFGCMLVANRIGSVNSASVTFCNCNGLLGHLALSTKDGQLVRYKSDNTGYVILDTSAAVTIAQGGTGATCAACARANLGLCDASTRGVYTLSAVGCSDHTTEANRTKVPDMNFISYWDGSYSCISATCHPSNLRYYCGGAFGSAAACAAGCFRPSTWTPSCVACAGQVMVGGVASTLGTASKCADSVFARAYGSSSACVHYAHIAVRLERCTGAVNMGGAVLLSPQSCTFTCTVTGSCFSVGVCATSSCTGEDVHSLTRVYHFSIFKCAGSAANICLTACGASASNPLYYVLAHTMSTGSNVLVTASGTLTTSTTTCLGTTYCTTAICSHLYVSRCPMPTNLYSPILYINCAILVSTEN